MSQVSILPYLMVNYFFNGKVFIMTIVSNRDTEHRHLHQCVAWLNLPPPLQGLRDFLSYTNATQVKKDMGLHYMHDGEFWMEFFVDFCREFEV